MGIVTRRGIIVSTPRAYHAAFAGVLICGVLLRVRAAAGDLWLDEIWSLDFAQRASSIAAILGWRHDNNHLLNTVYLYLCGPGKPEITYRLFAVVCGVAFQVLFWRWPLWRSDRERLIGAAFAAASYLLVLYSSEARGYAPMLVLELAATWLAWSWLDRPSEYKRLLFAITVMLALCAHVTAALFYAALLSSTLSRETRDLHRPAILGAAAFGLFFVRGYALGGGDPTSWTDALAAFALYTAGLPNFPLFAAGVVMFGVAELPRLSREDPRLFRLVTAALLLPVVATAVLRAEFVHPRYFLTMLPFVLLLLARTVETGLRAGGVRRIAVACAATAVIAGQYGSLQVLLSSGRGQYRAALNLMRAQSPVGTSTVGSDHDFRNRLLIEYYGRTPGPVSLQYVSRRQWATESPDWMILHSTSEAAQSNTVPYTNAEYDRVQFYRSAPLSGFTWTVYRKRMNTAAR